MPDDPRKDLEDALEAPLEERLRAALDKVREESDESKLDELERQLFELADKVPAAETAAAELDSIEDDFDARMARLEQKAATVRQQREAQVVQQERQLKSDANAAKGLGVGLSVAYAFIGMPVLGYIVAWGIDGKASGPNASWLVLTGVVLGVLGAAVLMKRANQVH